MAGHADERVEVCAVTDRTLPISELVPFAVLRPSITALLVAMRPDLRPESLIARDLVTTLRAQLVETLLREERGEFTALERAVVDSLARQETIGRNVEADFAEGRSLGERVSDVLARTAGSWGFIIAFGVVLAVWIALNAAILGRSEPFDPYPFILLNLILSCVAALQAPVIMMSQRRQETRDRLRALNDYRVNLKAELEIRHLHEKIDHLIGRQWERLAEIQRIQLELLEELGTLRKQGR